MAMEPSVTPGSPVTPTYWVDMIDVAIELPRGPAGEPGPSGGSWYSGNGDPSSSLVGSEGALYLDFDSGQVWVMSDGFWIPTGSSIQGPTGPAVDHQHSAYVPISGGAASPMTGTLYGNEGAVFDDPIAVGTPDQFSPDSRDAVNVEYLNRDLSKYNLARFFGDLDNFRRAVSTGPGWNSALEQGIYQQLLGSDAPPGVPTGGRTVGVVQKVSETERTQTVLDVQRGLIFVRTQKLGNWTDWAPVNAIIDTTSPSGYVPSASGKWGNSWPSGMMWIQLEGAV